MKNLIRLTLITACFSILITAGAQVSKNSPKGYSQANTSEYTAAQAPDFTITDTDGNTLNLYQTLNQGKTVFLDFFYTTCGFCIQYAPVIEQTYQNHGAGQGDIVFWGIDYNNDNAQVIAYKQANNISNPCASGTQGGGNQVTSLYQSNFVFTGWPTYTIICPDKTVHWDVNYPPSVNGFNQYFSGCGATGLENISDDQSVTKIVKLFPVPSGNQLTVKVNVNKSSGLRLDVMSLLGVKVISKEFEIPSGGIYDLVLSLSDLYRGNYFIKLYQDDMVRDIQKFTKIR